MRAEIRQAFASSNDRLGEMLNVDLADWGYSTKRNTSEEHIGETSLLEKWFDPLKKSDAL